MSQLRRRKSQEFLSEQEHMQKMRLACASNCYTVVEKRLESQLNSGKELTVIAVAVEEFLCLGEDGRCAVAISKALENTQTLHLFT